MLKKIVIHIGTHKTGSTALQAALHLARADLLAVGACYPRTDREPFADLPKHSSTYEAAIQGRDQFDAEMDLLIAEAEASQAHTLILSEEGFSAPRFAQFAGFLSLRERYEVQVLCLLRRQDYFIEALWNQYCREGRETRPVRDFANAPWNRERANYVPILDFWSRAGSVSVEEYDAVKADGIERFFSRATGIQLATPPGAHNVSVGMNTALVLSALPPETSEAERQMMVTAFDHDTQRLALGGRLREIILSDYAKSNAVLASRYGIRFPDKLPDDEPAHPLVRPDLKTVAKAVAKLTAIALRG